MPEWLKIVPRWFGRSMDGVTQTNLAPVIAFTCVGVVGAWIVLNAFKHSMDHPRLRHH